MAKNKDADGGGNHGQAVSEVAKSNSGKGGDDDDSDDDSDD